MLTIALSVLVISPRTWAQSLQAPQPGQFSQFDMWGQPILPTPKPVRPDESDAPTTLDAERMTGRQDRQLSLEREVEIQRGSMSMKSDRATYDVVDDRVQASGNIRLRNFGDRYSGDELNLKMDTGQGYMTSPTYDLEINKAHGKADRIDFESRERAVIQAGTYTTCEAPDPDWHLHAGKMSLDRERNIGTANNAVVIFKGVPVLASPYISFPMTAERKSGFLPPSIGTSNRGGLQVQLPYYWNIAPNRDLTLFPRIISQRGLQLGGHARYLGQNYAGQTKIEGMPDDQMAKRSRWALSSQHTQNLAPGLSLNANLNAASDDEYPNDFPSTITPANQRLLVRDLNLNYANPLWSASVRTTGYQILQDPLSPITRPYERLPQLTFRAGQTSTTSYDWSFGGELVNFWHPDQVRGTRIVANPRISYPIIYPGFFVTPSASLHATSYSLTNQTTGTPDSFSRVLPTLSVNSGMVFERPTSFLGRSATQTLEPRLFYVYTPYKDQSQFPTFDTALADFNYTQIFSENRYTGNDRISDSNQLTAALATRFIEESGIQRMNVALAQRFYFNNQQVVGDTTAETKSDILLLGTGQVSSTLALDSNFQYSPSVASLTRSNFGVRWRPGSYRALNVQYRRDLTAALRLIDISGQWPLAPRWYGVGRVNYSLQEHRLAEAVAGIEYKADCWVFRFVGQRTPTGTGVATSSFFLQLELNGLSKIGSNPLQTLRTNIPGYQTLTP